MNDVSVGAGRSKRQGTRQRQEVRQQTTTQGGEAEIDSGTVELKVQAEVMTTLGQDLRGRKTNRLQHVGCDESGSNNNMDLKMNMDQTNILTTQIHHVSSEVTSILI